MLLFAASSKIKKKPKKTYGHKVEPREILTLARVVKPTSVNWEHLATSSILFKEQHERKVRSWFMKPGFTKTARI